MPIRENPPAGAPIWVDLMSSDPEQSKAFYGELLGWGAEAPNPEFGGYTNLTKDGDRVAGLMQAQEGEPADIWSVYLHAVDAAATTQAARDAGATVIVDPLPIGDLGTMAVVLDPGGAATGMWQPAEHRGGVVATAGAPCHFELHTTAYDAVLPFYEKVFGWHLETESDTPEFRYSIFPVAEGEHGAVMDESPHQAAGDPSYWAIYVAVDDMDATLAKVPELGGKVEMGPDDTPYGVLAVATDATGARFSLRSGSSGSG
jgi:predicted enzyme related to lactoylglutathione lyase